MKAKKLNEIGQIESQSEKVKRTRALSNIKSWTDLRSIRADDKSVILVSVHDKRSDLDIIANHYKQVNRFRVNLK